MICTRISLSHGRPLKLETTKLWVDAQNPTPFRSRATCADADCAHNHTIRSSSEPSSTYSSSNFCSGTALFNAGTCSRPFCWDEARSVLIAPFWHFSTWPGFENRFSVIQIELTKTPCNIVRLIGRFRLLGL